MFIVIIVAVAGAIALSEVLSFLLLVILVLSGCLFAYLKIRGTELKTFLAQIRAAIERVLSLLRDKQEEFRDLNKDPSEFSLTELLVHANDEELDALQKFSKIGNNCQ